MTTKTSNGVGGGWGMQVERCTLDEALSWLAAGVMAASHWRMPVPFDSCTFWAPQSLCQWGSLLYGMLVFIHSPVLADKPSQQKFQEPYVED